MPRTYSHNSLSTYRDCPRKFKFQYIEKPEIPRKLTADTYLGTAVHRVLAQVYKLASNGVVLPLEKVLGDYMAEWDKPERKVISVANENLAVDDYIENGRKMLTRYYERFHPFDQGTLLGAEMYLRFTLPGTNFPFLAIVDRFWKKADGMVEIIDYKTGSRLPQGGRDPVFLNQMGLYRLAVAEKYPQFEQVELAQYFLKLDEVISYRPGPDELDELAERLRGDVLDVLQAERLDSFPTQEGGHCNYCDYFGLCPAKRHKQILEQEEGAGEEEKNTMETAADLATRFIEVDTRLKELKAEHEALKEDIIRAAEELSLDKLCADGGDVSVKRSRSEKFITKSADPSAFAELSHLARTWQLDEHFELNTRTLMKDIYHKQRLEPRQLEQLKAFVVESDDTRVTIRRKREEDEKE